MNTTTVLATSLALCAVALSAGATQAQSPCAVTRSVIDSARAEAVGILFSDRPLAAELRREQGIPQSAAQVSLSVVSDRALCERLASQFDHVLSPGAKFAVLRVGPIYYARDPDQRRATGLFADSTFHVVMRLGAAVDK
ncbi:MAG: hypothetical protein ACREPM_03875 [Gemmatimonadaceae bacterium]